LTKPRVLFTIPSAKGDLDRAVASWAVKLTQDVRCSVDVCYPMAQPSENARAHGMREFLGGPYDFWLSMDSDNPPGKNPLDLVELDLDLVGLPTPVWQHDSSGKPRLVWNVYERVGDEGYRWLPLETGGGLIRCDAIGTGCFLAARRVFESPAIRDGRPFQRHWKDDGTEALGSDLAFSRRVLEAGFAVCAHWGYLCHHYSELDLVEVMQLLTAAAPGTGVGRLAAEATHSEGEFTAGGGRFRAFDAWAVELETAELLAAIVGMMKPRQVLESGAGAGYSTAAILAGLEANGFGELVSFEPEEKFARLARERAWSPRVTVISPADPADASTLHWTGREPDMVFLDSYPPELRERELRHWLYENVTLVIHDANRYRELLRRQWGGQFYDCPRGLWIRLKRSEDDGQDESRPDGRGTEARAG